MDLSYILNQLGEDRASYRNAVVPPVFQSSIFAHATVAAMRAGLQDELNSNFYTRGNNPTVEILRKKVAALEGAEDCLMFGSGAAAIAAAVMSSVRSGDEIICVQKPYGWTRSLLRDLLPRFGVRTRFVDGNDSANFANAINENTRLIVLESPNSMTYEQQDLAAIAAIAQDRGIRTLCDNSYATPLHQSPLALGIDMVAHSATKYLSGHSDVVAGALCASSVIIREVFKGPYMTFGAMLAPQDAWLVIRGLRTLPIRMQRIGETAAQVVDFLQRHPKVARVYWPQPTDNPQAELSRSQLRGASGLLSIELAVEDVAAVERFCNALQRFLMTVSWGGYESLIFPVACVFPPNAPLRPSGGLPLTVVRLSIGLEDADVLIEDLDRALAEA